MLSEGSGALWLHPVALGRDAGSSLALLRSGLPCRYISAPISTISVSREAHASRATIITERDCCQSGIDISVSLGISGYLGMALVVR